MAGTCGYCFQDYTDYDEHILNDCPGRKQPNENSREETFAHEKAQQGWGDERDEEIWNEHFRNDSRYKY